MMTSCLGANMGPPITTCRLRKESFILWLMDCSLAAGATPDLTQAMLRHRMRRLTQATTQAMPGKHALRVLFSHPHGKSGPMDTETRIISLT